MLLHLFHFHYRVDVKRDSDWFHTVFPKIRNFWKEVLDARINPEKYMKKEKEPKSTKVVTKKSKKENCKIEFDIVEQAEDEVKTISLSNEQLDHISSDGYIVKNKEQVCLFEDSSED